MKQKSSAICRTFLIVPGRGLEPLRLRTRPSNVLVYQFQHPGRLPKTVFPVLDAANLRIFCHFLHIEGKKLYICSPVSCRCLHKVKNAGTVTIKTKDNEPFIRLRKNTIIS